MCPQSNHIYVEQGMYSMSSAIENAPLHSYHTKIIVPVKCAEMKNFHNTFTFKKMQISIFLYFFYNR